MSRFGSHYEVGRPTGRCAATGETLEPGTPCVATLCERPDDEGFERRDFAVSAWESGARPEGLFSYWKTVVPEVGGRRNLLVDDEVLLDLFQRLADDERPRRVAFRFVLGLILMRKRLLRFVGRKGEGESERWLLKPRGADPDLPPVEMVNPQLDESDVRELTDQLGEILQGEL